MSTEQLEKDLIREYKELHCPLKGCKGKFPAPWTLYEKGTDDKGLTVYQCPICKGEFTADNMSVNALRVANVKNVNFVWVNKVTGKVTFHVNSSNIFTDGTDFYIHVPILILNNLDLRMFSVREDASMEEVENEFKNIKNGEKVTKV